jgi:hypothetical protein
MDGWQLRIRPPLPPVPYCKEPEWPGASRRLHKFRRGDSPSSGDTPAFNGLVNRVNSIGHFTLSGGFCRDATFLLARIRRWQLFCQGSLLPCREEPK